MTLLRAHAAVLAFALAFPAAASADAPWAAPSPVDGVSSTTTLLSTQLDGRILIGTSSARSLASPTVVARVQPDGSTARRQELAIAYAKAATYARAGVVVAGSRPAQSTTAAERAPVVVALGSLRGIHDLGAPHALAGTQGQVVSAVGGNPRSTIVAVVTASLYDGGTSRQLWVRRGGVFRRALRFTAGTNARETAVAVGPSGDVLLVWQGRRTIFARHLGPTGRPGAVHRLGTGVQSALQAHVAGDGRLEVAWLSQRVAEGDALSPADINYTSAPRGGGFSPARRVGGSPLTGTGRYVKRPGVRLVERSPGSSMLAWTDFDGKRFRVRIADVTAGVVGAPQTVTPTDDDAVLGDLASSPAGGDLVLWLTGTRGNDSTGGPQRVGAAVRAPGAAAFGPPELVSEPVAPRTTSASATTTVPFAPSAAVDPRSGQRFAAWTTLSGQTKVAVRPAG